MVTINWNSKTTITHTCGFALAISRSWSVTSWMTSFFLWTSPFGNGTYSSASRSNSVAYVSDLPCLFIQNNKNEKQSSCDLSRITFFKKTKINLLHNLIIFLIYMDKHIRQKYLEMYLLLSVLLSLEYSVNRCMIKSWIVVWLIKDKQDNKIIQNKTHF